MTGKITERQFSFLCQLVEQKDLSSLDVKQREFLLSEPKNFWKMTKEQASNAISKLVNLPKVPVLIAPPPVQALESTTPQVADDTNGKTAQVQAQVEALVPQGRYFIVDPTDGVEKFYRVNKPKDGRWKGYTFLEVQASDYFYPIRNAQHREAIFTEIAKDPITSMDLYGIKLGLCGRCGRKLTKRSSRLRGLGPICADIMEGVEPDVQEATPEDIQMLIDLGLLKEGE